MRLFISYRRADTQVTARAMKTFLDQIPRIDEVFLDFDEIGIGSDFEQAIQTALAKSSHCLILIGPGWKGAGADGAARIFDPEDFVRREAALALDSEAKVIPILVDGALMPKAADLPEELKRLPKINAFQLRTSHFNEDMDDLLDVVFGRKARAGSRWRRAPLTAGGIAARIAGGLALAFGLIVAVGIVSDLLARGSGGCGSLACRMRDLFGFERQEDALGPLYGLIAAVLAAGAALPFLPRWLGR